MIITLIGLIVILSVGLVAMIKTKPKNSEERKTKTDDIEEKNDTEEDKKDERTIKRGNHPNIPQKDIFDFMEFDKIEDDMIIQNGDSRFTMVIQCKGINYDLMSDVEQLAVEEGFIVFLNTLKYPIQLYVQARTVDLKKTMELYKDRVNYFEKQYNDYDEKYKKMMNKLDASEREIEIAKNERAKFANIYEYATDINRYVERLSVNKNILQRRFYIALSYDKSEINSNASFSKGEIHDICRRELYTRSQSLISSLMSCSVVGKILDSDSLAELLYISYHRDDERILNIRSALDSGFYRLYSTSKDVYDKKREKIQEEVSKEAISRVQQAIKMTVRQSDIKTPEQIEDEFEEDVDREAINIIRNAEISKEDKEKLSTIIAENHVINSKERQEKRKNQNKIEENKQDENIELYSENDEKNNVYESEEDDSIV